MSLKEPKNHKKELFYKNNGFLIYWHNRGIRGLAMTKKEIEKEIKRLQQFIDEENQQERQRYIYLFVLYCNLETLQNKLKELEQQEDAES